MVLLRPIRNGIIPAMVIAVFMLWPTSPAFAANFEVIANKNVNENTLSKAELQAIFLGEKVKWENRKYIKVAILENGLAYVDFLRSIVGKTPSQFDQHWMRLISTGRATMPPAFTDSQQLIEYIAKQPNAIGIVAPQQGNGSVKIISVK